MEEEPRWVRVMLRNGRDHTFFNAKYQADFRSGVLTVYRPFEDESEELARFDLDTVRYYEYFVEE
jgi:hypothetical protein